MQDRREAGGRGDVDLGAQEESRPMSQGDERGAAGRRRGECAEVPPRSRFSSCVRQRREQRPRGPITRHLSPEQRVEPPRFSHTAVEPSQPALIKNNELSWFFRETAHELSVRVTERPLAQMCPSGRGFEILRRPPGDE